MLDQETKRKINNARDVLVGKVPDPKAQVEQITTALIYKFMDDMDRQAEELGGKPSFFTGDFKKYSWGKLMDPRIGGQGRFNLYDEALEKMEHNSNLPELFREIFKTIRVPFRDPETLSLFLKEINNFSYEDSENLGDAYEYLLSVLGTQKKLGQFRTPRHIIDFIIKILDPKKDETILDPACGTAGFLISAYKHIIKNHDCKDNKTGKPTDKEIPLTPDERKKMMNNFVGYDIEPTMRKFSLVNMYLHGFSNPKIFEYDTLTYEDRWDETFDVIIANPPFMTPKGGIRPHKRFSIQAKKSEALFVGYILEHLNQKGRAGIIVPEGIIFKSENAYKQLRKVLVEDGLWAVVSLPQGVFNPYAGVKTSVLLFDNSRAKLQKEICFVKIENDGFNLGAQRREIEKNDLPKALEILRDWKNGKKKRDKIANWATKEEIAISGDYNLTGNLYRETVDYSNVKWEMVELGEVCGFVGGYAFKSSGLINYSKGEFIPVIKIGNLNKSGLLDFNKIQYYKYTKKLDSYFINKGDILIAMTGATVGKVAISDEDNLYLNQRVGLIRTDNENLFQKYLKYLFLTDKFYNYCQRIAGGGAQGNISPKQILKFKIPFPPLKVQKQIVAEIDGYQKIIDGARQVVENWKPTIKIDPKWRRVELGEVCEFNPKKSKIKDLPKNQLVSFVPMANLNEHQINFEVKQEKKIEKVYSGYTYFAENDVLLARVTPCFENGKSGIAKHLTNKIGFGSSEYFIYRANKEKILPEWIYYFISSDKFIKNGKNNMRGTGGLQRLTKEYAISYKIPFPSLKIQKQIVAKIETEQKIIDQNKELIEIFEGKIKEKIGEVL